MGYPTWMVGGGKEFLMKRNVRTLLSLVIACTLLPIAALAEGTGPMPTPSQQPTAQPKTPQQLAVEHYNAGVRMRDKAWKLEGKLLQAPEEKKRVKIAAKIERQYKLAIKEFSAATQKNPRLHQAHGSLGYALRKTGQYKDALTSYDRAIRLAPDYAEAIEYRAEAYLGLGRLEDAKKAYMKLFGMNRGSADTLLMAMQEWVEKRSSDAGDLSADTVSEFAGWVAARADVARETASLSQQQKRKW